MQSKLSTRGRIPCQSFSSPLMNQRPRSLGKITSWKLSWGSGARRSLLILGLSTITHSHRCLLPLVLGVLSMFAVPSFLALPSFQPALVLLLGRNGASSWEAQLSDFHTHHITIQDLSQAYRHLTTLQIIPVPFGASSGRQLAGLRQLLGTCNVPGLRESWRWQRRRT